MHQVGEFIGRFTIRWVAGENPVLSPGMTLCVGTGRQGDRAPWLSDGYNTLVGFRVLDRGEPVSVAASEDGGPMPLLWNDGVLEGFGVSAGQPLRVQISLLEITSPGGVTSRFLYGTTVLGDPDNVAVWGAEDSPPEGEGGDGG